jgi:ankyrin repeat protein
MKQLSLITSLFLFTSHTCHTMELIKRKKHHINKPEPIQIHNVHLNAMIYKTDGRGDIPEDTDANYIQTQRLMKGVDWDDLALIQRGIATGGNVNYTYFERYSPTHLMNLNLIQIACVSKEYKTVKALLTSPDVNIYAHTKNTKPAFDLAVARKDDKGKDGIIDLLINYSDKNGNTLLHYACWNRDAEKTNLLLEKGARTTIKGKYGFTPLAIAYFKKPSTFDLFYSKKLKKLVLNRDNNYNTQLHFAASLNMGNIVYQDFKQYINFLLTQGLSLWSRNFNNNELPVDIASKKYTAMCETYIKEPPLGKTISHMDILNQELILHCFLQLNSSQKQCALFTHLLQKHLRDNFGNISKDGQTCIAKMYYIVNIETVVANKYKTGIKGVEYCHACLENKEKIKYAFLIKPEPKFLWSA